MERNRETRRASVLGSNGFNRRRHRTNSLRDSPDEDGGVELRESVRLRDRVKKDRDRERERDVRERDLRERPSRSKRRRGDDETSEESLDDDEDDEDEENTATAAAAALLPPPPGSVSNHHFSHSSTNNHHIQHRKSFPTGFSSSSSSSSSKVFSASPVWKPGDEIISVSVPRKARSASTKRSHDWISSSSNNINGGAGSGESEQILQQASSSPTRQSGVVSTSTPSPAALLSFQSSNSFFKKKLKPNGNSIGPRLKPPKASPSKQNFPNHEELEIEIAEVLYGLMTQSQGPSSKKDNSKEVNRSNGDAKSSAVSNSGPLQYVAPQEKRPRQVVEDSGHGVRPFPVSFEVGIDQASKSEISSSNPVKITGSTGENGFEVGGNSVNSQGQPAAQPPEPPVAEEIIESRDSVIKEDMKEIESCAVNNDSGLIATASSSVADTMIKANSMVSEVEIQREQKFEIDLMMAPPPQARSSPEWAAPLDQKPILSTESRDKEDEKEEEKSAKEKSANMASWPGGLLPQMGYMSPLQGVVPMDGTAIAPSPIQPLFTQPRPKRCATHCYIARNVHCLRQFMKMNPFWQAAAGPASLFGSKSCSFNVMPADPVGNMAGRGLNNAHDKGYSLASGPNPGGKDKGSQTVISSSDSARREKQFLIQQALPSVGPTFICPLNQQQAAVVAAAASARPGSTKPHPTTAGTSSSNPSFSPGGSASAVAAAGAATAMSFNYHPMAAANETQYLAILQNNGYPFPIPAVGAHPPNYRGPSAQAMPLFNGSFYLSQMIHPSQIQQKQSTQPSQNASASNGPSSSQKNLPIQQQPRPPQSNGGPGSANLQNYPSQKSQQSLQSNNQQGHPSRPRRLESGLGREDSPTTKTDSGRGSRPPVTVYGPNFATLIYPQQPQQFAMSFGTINGSNTLPGYDHAIFRSFPEVTRRNIQMMAQSGAGQQSIEFTRSDLADPSVPSIQANNVVNECSGQSLNVSSGYATRTSRPVTNNAVGAINIPNVHIQGQLHQQLKQQQQMAINRSKTPVSSNGPVFSRTPISQAQSSLASSATTSIKNQHSRLSTQTHNQISFVGNKKPSTASQSATSTFVPNKFLDFQRSLWELKNH